MGVIGSLPINTTKIDELPIYGTVDSDAKKKDLIEISKNSGTSGSPVYAVGGSRKIPLDEFQSLIGQAPRLFEKYDKYEVVFSTFTDIDESFDGKFEEFEVTPEMQGYYLRMEVVTSNNGGNNNLIWGNNRGWLLNFVGTFPDGFAVRIEVISLGASKCDISDKYLTSGKVYDFVYNLEAEEWSINELENLENPVTTYLTMYKGDSPYRLILTNTNHSYLFKIHSIGAEVKELFLLPTSLWRGRKIAIYIDNDFISTKELCPAFYPTPYADCTGTNDYTGVFVPIIDTALNGLQVWVKFANEPSGVCTLDAGFGAKKMYISGVQVTTGDIYSYIIYQYHYDETLDSANGGWAFDREIAQRDLIDGETSWKFPFGESGAKKGSYVVFESDGFGSIKIADMNIVL